ncbi:hypothetical protein [Hydrogenophaga sp. 2FB]|uniref:hypothetical protein n=1 Tax=Hydrogenophaga sp. 2FB TaxID=2502187 RepID=UPI0010F9DF1D|nr:hypothetical protein [Hydrogenophaga sp. 2FB]
METVSTPPTDEPQLPELSPAAFDMLRSALNLAREQGIQKVATLRARMKGLWPDRSEEIDQAIAFWASSTARRHPGGIPRY